MRGQGIACSERNVPASSSDVFTDYDVIKFEYDVTLCPKGIEWRSLKAPASCATPKTLNHRIYAFLNKIFNKIQWYAKKVFLTYVIEFAIFLAVLETVFFHTG